MHYDLNAPYAPTDAQAGSRPASTAPSAVLPFQLFQRAGSANWWVRFSIKGEGQIRRSLETRDRVEAETKAMEAWADAKHRAKLGLRSQTKRFGDVAAEFLAHTAQAVARGERNKSQAHNWALKVNRYLVEFFGDRDIDAIGQREITRYLEWRRNYWISGPGQNVEQITYQRGGRTVRRRVPPQLRRPPSPATQRHEAVAIKALFRQAAEWGYVQPSAIPHINVPRVIAKPRPSFEASEFTRLEAAALARLEEEFLHPSVRRDRLILYCYIKVAAFSGMRPTELKNLNWGDILDYRERRQLPLRDRDIRIRARGKAKSRTFVAMEVVLPVLDMLWSDWVRLHGSDPADKDPVFATTTGARLGSVKTALNGLLAATGLAVDHNGVRRTSYSFRHFYISQQIIAGVDVFLLARNCGTSVEMIDKWYADVKLERMSKELRPEWKRLGGEN